MWPLDCACGQPRCECRNPAISHMKHLWDDLKVLHRPLVVQLTSELCALFTDAWLRRQGFERFRHQVSLPVTPFVGSRIDVSVW